MRSLFCRNAGGEKKRTVSSVHYAWHRCLAGALINDVFYVSMEILLWQMAAGAATGTAAAVLYLGGAVLWNAQKEKGCRKRINEIQ